MASSSSSEEKEPKQPKNNNSNNDESVNGSRGEQLPSSSSEREAATGWTHNVPSESSNFWIGNDDGEKQRLRGTKFGESSSSTPFRTGWLHGPASSTPPPASTAAAAAKQEPSSSSQKKTKNPNLARERLNLAMTEGQRNHRIVSPVAFHATSTSHAIAVTEHVISVPLKHDNNNNKNKERFDLYFTIVEKVDSEEKRSWLLSLAKLPPNKRAQRYVQESKLDTANGLCLYLQGGPGFGAPTPVAGLGFDSPTSSWAAQALHTGTYQKICLMDQRGMGRSTPITKQTLQLKFPNLFLLDHVAATDPTVTRVGEFAQSYPNETAQVRQTTRDVVEFMSCFRADSIVRDAELVKEALLYVDLDSDDYETNKNRPKPWGACLGQSYGGFCLLTYLSQIQHPPKVCLFTGGIAPILSPLFEVYTKLWKRVQTRCNKYYDMYPGDIRVVKQIVQRLLVLEQQNKSQPLPGGGILTARRFLQMGLNYLGSSPSSFAAFHAFLAGVFVVDASAATAETLVFRKEFLKTVESSQSFDDHPLYYWLHESIYANGGVSTTATMDGGPFPEAPTNNPTYWSAHRAYEFLVLSKPELWDYQETSQLLDDDTVRTLFFGEMIFPWMCEGDYVDVSGLGARELAHALAEKEDWGPLYDMDHIRTVLREGCSRAAAAVYYNDLYVDFDASVKVIEALEDQIPMYVTNEYQHSGLQDDGAAIFAKLHGMAMGVKRIPS